MPGLPLAVGGPSYNTKRGPPRREDTLRSKTLLFLQKLSIFSSTCGKSTLLLTEWNITKKPLYIKIPPSRDEILCSRGTTLLPLPSGRDSLLRHNLMPSSRITVDETDQVYWADYLSSAVRLAAQERFSRRWTHLLTPYQTR